MKGIDIIEAMENIDEKLLLDAKNHRRAVPGWLKWTSLAACVCCALVVGILSLGWILDDSAHPEPLPEALAEPEESTWGSEIIPESPVTLQSSKYPLSITVPAEYADHVLVDTPYYYGMDGECIIENDDAIFSFFVNYNEENQLNGLVWFILATEPIPSSDEYYEGQNELAFMFSSSILGSDESHTYLLCHPGLPKDHCFDGANIEAAKTYLEFAQDSIDILREFIYDNDLTSDWKWKERFTEFTITPTETTVSFLTALTYYNAPTATFSSEQYPVTLTVPEQYSGDIHVDSPFASTFYSEEVFYNNVAFSFHYNYSAEATDAGLVFLITATPISEFDYDRYEEIKDYATAISTSMIGEDSEYVYQIVYPLFPDHPFVANYDVPNMAAYLDYLYAGLAILDKFVQENDLSLRSDWYNYFSERPISGTQELLKQLETTSSTSEPSPTPTAAQEVSAEVTESILDNTVTLRSSNYPLSLTVPAEYADHVLVDTPYYYEGDGETGMKCDDVVFSFYVDYTPKNQLDGFVWFIAATPLTESSSFYFSGEDDGRYMFTSIPLGSNETYTYLLCHPGIPEEYCFDGTSMESAKKYLTYATDSINILREFIYDNDLITDFKWKEHFTGYTITTAEDALADLLMESIWEDQEGTSPVTTYSSSTYPVSLSIPEKYVDHVLVDTPYYYDTDVGGIIEDEEVVFSLFVDYSEKNQLNGLIWFILATPLMEDFSDYYAGPPGDRYMFNSTILGSDENHTYLLCHPGYPDDECFNDESLEEAKTYLEFARDSVEILEGFIIDNELSADLEWKERFVSFTVTPAKDALAKLLLAEAFMNSPVPTPTAVQPPSPTPGFTP